ncbi:MAG: LacI family DNA-binding transcriptional regulator, partial [Clostridia bacterium]
LILLESPQDLWSEEPLPRCALLAGYSSHWFSVSASALSIHGIQPILVSAYTPMDERYSAVYFSMPSATRESLCYLRQAGRTRVALIGINPDSPADRRKEEVFQSESTLLDMAGCVSIPCGGISMQTCVERFLCEVDQFDAVMGANDVVSICVIQALEREGYKVPEDLFVMGMGNSHIGRMLHEPLTTVDFDYELMGYSAVNLYYMMLSDASGMRLQMALPFRIMVRATTANLRILPSEEPKEAQTHSGNPSYYSDPDVRRLNNIEELLQRCDEWDIKVIEGILRSDTYEQIAFDTHFSERAIKYRVQKILHKANLTHRTQLCDTLRTYWWVRDR